MSLCISMVETRKGHSHQQTGIFHLVLWNAVEWTKTFQICILGTTFILSELLYNTRMPKWDAWLHKLQLCASWRHFKFDDYLTPFKTIQIENIKSIITIYIYKITSWIAVSLQWTNSGEQMHTENEGHYSFLNHL